MGFFNYFVFGIGLFGFVAYFAKIRPQIKKQKESQKKRESFQEDNQIESNNTFTPKGKCLNCGKEFEDGSSNCLYCGTTSLDNAEQTNNFSSGKIQLGRINFLNRFRDASSIFFPIIGTGKYAPKIKFKYIRGKINISLLNFSSCINNDNNKHMIELLFDNKYENRKTINLAELIKSNVSFYGMKSTPLKVIECENELAVLPPGKTNVAFEIIMNDGSELKSFCLINGSTTIITSINGKIANSETVKGNEAPPLSIYYRQAEKKRNFLPILTAMLIYIPIFATVIIYFIQKGNL